MPVCEPLAGLAGAGVPDLAGSSPEEFAAHAGESPEEPGAVFAVHPSLVPASRLAAPAVNEGICWLVQEPKALERNHRFVTIGSRNKRDKALDARTPAIWISGGTGHDGTHHRNAPKVGWCWAGNRHTWLGFAAARRRVA